MLSSSPSLRLQDYLRRAEALLRGGDMQGALQIAHEAVESGADNSNLLTLAAYWDLDAGLPQRALDKAARARQLAPRSADALQVHGIAFARLGRHRDAVVCFDAALRQAPAIANVHYSRGLSLEELQEFARAEREYRRTVEIEPRHTGALAQLAALAASRGHAAAARDYAQRALRIDPAEPAALLSLAQIELEQGSYAEARRIAEPLAARGKPINRSIALGLLADAFHKEGRVAEAFRHYQDSNAVLQAYYRPVFEAEGVETAAARARRFIEFFKTDAAAGFAECHSGAYRSPVSTHVFLVGFPRSGTTLLEQVLASHSAVETLEERDCLAAAIAEFALPPDELTRLAAQSGDALSSYRDAYWREAQLAGAKLDRRAFVDKLPLNSLLLCIVAKLFPNSKVLFALRDPRDVVLSCFRRRFRMNPQMYELLTIEGAAAYYNAIMSLAELYRAHLPLAFRNARYEDLVNAFDGETASVCDFLGIAPEGTMAGFAERAAERGLNTPSAAQVARGLYTEGIGQWQAYRSHLEPVLPIVAPWVSRFGYAES
jgi:Tfp pilus assembly protein PilF